MKLVSSKAAKALVGVVLLILLTTLLAWYAVSESRSNHFKSWAREQAYAMQPGDIPTNNIVFGIQIVGSNDFPLQIARALLLLKLCDFETFTRVTNAVGIVQEDSRSNAAVTNKPPLIRKSRKTAFVSLTWCAGGLVHEARHLELARRRRAAPQIYPYDGYKPRGYKDFQREELDCIALQLEVLKKLGAPRRELDLTRAQDGTHFDVNRDGKWDEEDTRLQNW